MPRASRAEHSGTPEEPEVDLDPLLLQPGVSWASLHMVWLVLPLHNPVMEHGP